jgi:hypothetical protein
MQAIVADDGESGQRKMRPSGLMEDHQAADAIPVSA